MNNKFRAIVMACTCLYMPAAWSAGDNEWFGALKVSLGDDTIDDITHHGTIGTGLPLGGDIDGQINDTEVGDYTAGIGVAIGKRFGNWAVEGEFVWRYRTDWDIAAATPSINTITNVFSDVETNTLLLNLIRRGTLNQHWSWELGAGIGLAKTDIDASYIERSVPGISPELRFKDGAGDTEFAYNILAGLTRKLGGPWTLNIRYRYIDLGELSAGPFPNRPARLSADYLGHDLQLSLEREF